MTLNLTPQESENIFFNILCNCISIGYLNSYGIELSYNREHYKDVASRLKNSEFEGSVPTHEMVLLGMLQDKGELIFEDIECDGEYTSVISLQDIRTKVQTAPLDSIKASLDGSGDVTDEDIILQHILYGEIIFS